MKNDKNLEGLIWTGQALNKPNPNKIAQQLELPSIETPRTILEWNAYWKLARKRVATMPEIYLAAKEGLITFKQDKQYILTPTQITYSPGWKELSFNKGLDTIQFRSPCESDMFLENAIHDETAMMRTLFDTDDPAATMHGVLKRYFNRSDKFDMDRLHIHFFDKFNEVDLKRYAALIGGIGTGITMVSLAEITYGYTYGVDLK